MGRIFGTDGARGIANVDLTVELAVNIGRAAGMVLEKKLPKFLIGEDTRISSDMLRTALCAGLTSVGADAIILGVVPTPAIPYLIGELKADAGIMISASHNPFADNGIKLFNSKGFKLTDEQEEQIESIILDTKEYNIKQSGEIGKISELRNASDIYVNHICSSINENFKDVKVLVDCSNGSASITAKKIFKALGAECTVINSSPNGININDNCGSTHIGSLVNMMKTGAYDVGFALDGDADRCLAVDENGEIVDGDKIMAILAYDMKKENKLKNNTLVLTVMSNLGLFKFAEKHGINIETTKVGDRYILENMLENGHNLGGEQSGHTILLDSSSTGDGQLSAVKILEIMQKTKKSLSELSKIMKIFPQIMINIKADSVMKDIASSVKMKSYIEMCEEKLASSGKIIVRASGTEPLVRIMVEGNNEKQIHDIANEIAKEFEKLYENCK